METLMTDMHPQAKKLMFSEEISPIYDEMIGVDYTVSLRLDLFGELYYYRSPDYNPYRSKPLYDYEPWETSYDETGQEVLPSEEKLYECIVAPMNAGIIPRGTFYVYIHDKNISGEKRKYLQDIINSINKSQGTKYYYQKFQRCFDSRSAKVTRKRKYSGDEEPPTKRFKQ